MTTLNAAQDSLRTEWLTRSRHESAVPQGSWAKALPWLAVAFLLSAAWLLAKWGPVGPGASLDEIESTSAVSVLIIAGAAPWLLQWAAAGIVAAMVLRRYLKGNWAPLLLALACTLVAGLFFWGRWGFILWGTDPQEAVLEVTARSLAIKMGGGTFGESILYRIVGPVVCPITLSGPLEMQGWSFLWAGLSSFLVIVFWTWGGAWCGVPSEWREPTFQGTCRLFVVIVGYTAPAWLRLALTAGGLL